MDGETRTGDVPHSAGGAEDDVAARLERRLRVLSEVTSAFAAATGDLDGLLQSIARAVAAGVGDACGVWLLDDERARLSCAAYESTDAAVAAAGRAHFGGSPVVLAHNAAARSVIEAGTPTLMPRFDPESLRPPASTAANYEHAKRTGTASLLRVPLRAHGSALGMLTLSRNGAGAAPYDERDLQLAQLIADHASLALLNGRALAEAREAREAERVLFAASPVPMYVLDEESTGFLDVNDACCALYGYARAEMLALRLVDLTAHERRPELSQRLDETRDLDRTRGRAIHVTKNGDRRTIAATTKRVTYRGRPGRLVVLDDMTEREELEKQLRQAQKMEAIGNLAGGIAHDFNNLLSVIVSYADLIAETVGPEASFVADLDEIRRAGERAASLTRQLLAYSRRQILKPRDVDINVVTGEMLKLFRRLVPEAIDLELKARSAVGLVHVDPSQLEQVLMNLVANARDALPDGGHITLETADVDIGEEYVATHLDVKPGPYVMLAVSDDGVGMSKEVLAHIFEPYFTTKKLGKGTGLGLSTVFGIVKQSGGSLYVYSEPGRGTTFKVFFPRLPAAQMTSSAEEAGRRQGKETILLVEDEEQVRRLAARILERAGYHVITAGNGEEALALVEAEADRKIDLVVTDVVMPKMSGRELWSRLHQRRPELKVIFMSGYTDDAIVHTGVLEQEIPFLQKPLLPAPLLARVREVIDG